VADTVGVAAGEEGAGAAALTDEGALAALLLAGSNGVAEVGCGVAACWAAAEAAGEGVLSSSSSALAAGAAGALSEVVEALLDPEGALVSAGAGEAVLPALLPVAGEALPAPDAVLVSDGAGEAVLSALLPVAGEALPDAALVSDGAGEAVLLVLVAGAAVLPPLAPLPDAAGVLCDEEAGAV